MILPRMFEGEVIGIYIAPEAGDEMLPVDEVHAVPGRGLEGDRYFVGEGTFSKKADPGRELTLVESESIAALERDYEIEIEPGQTRRNITTKGVPLSHLVGVEFAIGGIKVKGVKLAEPCGHLERLTGKPIKPGLVHRGGLRAQILNEGVIKVGDAVRSAEEEK